MKHIKFIIVSSYLIGVDNTRQLVILTDFLESENSCIFDEFRSTVNNAV